MEENTISSCLGSEVIFTCTVNQTDTIQWEIDFLTIPDINRVGYFQNDPVGQRLQAFSEDIVINFNLTSKSPLTSTMTTIASPDLYGAKVSCLDGLSSEAQVDSHVIDAVLGKYSYHCLFIPVSSCSTIGLAYTIAVLSLSSHYI